MNRESIAEYKYLRRIAFEMIRQGMIESITTPAKPREDCNHKAQRMSKWRRAMYDRDAARNWFTGLNATGAPNEFRFQWAVLSFGREDTFPSADDVIENLEGLWRICDADRKAMKRTIQALTAAALKNSLEDLF